METIQQPVDILKSEEGFMLISVLLVLLILTAIGIAGTKTTSFELKIASNERQANQIFCATDSGWKQSGPTLNALASPPDIINQALRDGDTAFDWGDEYYQIVRNFGDGDDAMLNDDFGDNTEDGRITATNTDIPYWYRIAYEDDIGAVGFGTGYRDFQYITRCKAGKTEVDVQVNKVYQVGY